MSYCKPHHFACECREEFYTGVVKDLQETITRLRNTLERLSGGIVPTIAGMASDYRKMTRDEMMKEAKWILDETKGGAS